MVIIANNRERKIHPFSININYIILHTLVVTLYKSFVHVYVSIWHWTHVQYI